MSTPSWHCSEICTLLSGSAKAAACPSSTHQMEQQWQDEHGTEHLLLAPWKAVMWLPQHSTQPSGGAMADGGQPRPQTQSHRPEGPSCKSGDTFRIKFGRWLQSLNTSFRMANWSSMAHQPRVPHCGHGTGSDSPSTCSHRPGAGRGG